jgi:flagellar FliL protein
LKLTIKLELDRAEAADELKNRTPALRDSILILLSSKESTALRTAQGKLQLRDEIVQRVNGLLPRPWVKTAYFLEFVLQ